MAVREGHKFANAAAIQHPDMKKAPISRSHSLLEEAESVLDALHQANALHSCRDNR